MGQTMKFLASNPKTNPLVVLCYCIMFAVGINFFLPSWSYTIGFFFLLFWIGHGLGQHRYLSHNAFQLNKLWHTVVVYIASIVPFGSPLGWAVLHRLHHVYNSTEYDTYFTKNPFKIFFCMTNSSGMNYIKGRHLNDKVTILTHRYYHINLVLFNIGLFLLNPAVWISYVSAGLLVCAAFIWTWAVAHKKMIFSYQNYKDNSYNDLFCGYVLGEWHNNHHSHPNKSNQQVRWWELDILHTISKVIGKNA